MFNVDEIAFWKRQAEQNAAEIASLRETLKTERVLHAHDRERFETNLRCYRKLLDCYRIALNAFMEDVDEH